MKQTKKYNRIESGEASAIEQPRPQPRKKNIHH
jgi:hypothetical protein